MIFDRFLAPVELCGLTPNYLNDRVAKALHVVREGFACEIRDTTMGKTLSRLIAAQVANDGDLHLFVDGGYNLLEEDRPAGKMVLASNVVAYKAVRSGDKARAYRVAKEKFGDEDEDSVSGYRDIAGGTLSDKGVTIGKLKSKLYDSAVVVLYDPDDTGMLWRFYRECVDDSVCDTNLRAVILDSVVIAYRTAKCFELSACDEYMHALACSGDLEYDDNSGKSDAAKMNDVLLAAGFTKEEVYL